MKIASLIERPCCRKCWGIILCNDITLSLREPRPQGFCPAASVTEGQQDVKYCGQTESREFITNKQKRSKHLCRWKSSLTLVNCQDLWVEVLDVVFFHHVLIYGQPRCANTQFSGPREAQLLQRKDNKEEKWVTFPFTVLSWITNGSKKLREHLDYTSDADEQIIQDENLY